MFFSTRIRWLVFFIFVVFAGSARACLIVGDLSGDCRVDIADLLLMVGQWLTEDACVEQGLVGRWRLDESVDAVAEDSSESGLDGVVFGEALWNPAGGRILGALQFDGIDDYVEIEGFWGITGSAPRSYAAWIQTAEPGGELITWGEAGTASARWIVRLDEGGLLRLEVGPAYALGSRVLVDDMWHHVAVVSDGTTMDAVRLYIDGQIETISNLASQTINTTGTQTVKIGVHAQTQRYYKGLMDDVRIYDRALTSDEIWALAVTGTTDLSCGDLNADEQVNITDFSKLAECWNEERPPVTINEFLAENDEAFSTWVDGNEVYPDWIEINNNTTDTIDLSGWYLTDDAQELNKWSFPSGIILASGDYLIVFASSKKQSNYLDNYPYVDDLGYLHTNFKLSNDGEYLALIGTDGTTVVHEYDSFDLGGGEFGYPWQQGDISYGCFYGEHRYFSDPTPGTVNRSAFDGLVETPLLSPGGGCYPDVSPRSNHFFVTVSCPTEEAIIRYTTNRTAPTLTNGRTYTSALYLYEQTTIMVKAFKPGYQPSETVIQSYMFLEDDVKAFTSNLPIIVIDSLGETVNYGDWEYTPSPTVVIDTDKDTGRAAITAEADFASRTGFRVRGRSSSFLWPKRQYALEVWDENNEDVSASILGFPAESDYILLGPYSDKSLIRTVLPFMWSNEIGRYAVRTQMVEMFLNTGNGKISYDDYRGVYVLMEKVKRDESRVDITRLDPSDNSEPEITGGYLLRKDWGESPYFTSDYGIRLEYREPKSNEITQPQKDYIKGYINDHEASLYGNNFTDPVEGYTKYIDVGSFIDHHLLVEITFNLDAYYHSTFMYKDRGGKINMGPIWDYNLTLGNFGGGTNGWVYTLRPGEGYDGTQAWYLRLMEDPEFELQVADRWFHLRETEFDTDKLMADIDRYAALLDEAQERNFEKWPILGKCIQYNASGCEDRDTYQKEIDFLKEWLQIRLDWIDNRMASERAFAPPIFYINGSTLNQGAPVEIGDVLTITNPTPNASEIIYYTLDGTDPRVSAIPDPDSSVTIVTVDAPKRVLVSTSNIGTTWRGGSEPYVDSAWNSGTPVTPGRTGGVGYDRNTEYNAYLSYDVKAQMHGQMASCYIRIPFEINLADLVDYPGMTLKIQYDDGFVAYLNGHMIESANIDDPENVTWNDNADDLHADSSAKVFQTFPISAANRNWLQDGQNILAIHGLNLSTGSSDFLISAELVVGNDSSTSGSISPTAIAYTGPVSMSKSMQVKARSLSGGEWSALNEATFAVGPVAQSLRISEIMYHPTDPTPEEITATGDPSLTSKDFEFIELKNVGDVAVNLNLVHFGDGVDFTFVDHTLDPGEYTVLVRNQAAFAARYGVSGIDIVPGSYLGALANDGEEIVLRDAIGAEIHDFDYEDSWFKLTDGMGFSLTMTDPASTDPNDWDAKFGWRSSVYADGTPGLPAQMALAADSIVINELLAHSHAADTDWIELRNTTGSAIDISGWFLSNDDRNNGNIMKYQFQDNTVIPSYGFLSLDQSDTFGNPSSDGCNIAFGLSEGGETVYLYSSQNGEVTGFYQTQQKFDASETDVTFGRYEKAELSGGYDFVRQSAPSLEAVNKGPLIPDVVITEIYYNPVEGIDYEFVELHNRSGSDVTLMTEVTTETSLGVFVTEDIPWRLEGVGYEFPDDTVIGAGQHILIARNPTAYSSAPCDVYGPYNGKLDDGGEELELQIPGDQEYGKDRYWIPIEKIQYDDEAPWPTAPDGRGDSLHRKDISAYGRDYSNWRSLAPIPGS